MKKLSQLAGIQAPFEGENSLLSFRSLKYLLTWLILWQDSSVSGSVFQILENFGTIGSFHYFEMWLIIIFILFVLERILKSDFTLRRSYFYAPLLLMGFALVFSYIRGMWILQKFTTVYEIHEAIQLPLIFFIFLNFYRDPGEWKILFIMMVTATIPKAADGVWIYLYSNDEGKTWGVLQMWRDGFLLALGVTTAQLLIHYKGRVLKWLKILMLVSLPLIVYTLIRSYRRTFFVAIIVCCVTMFFSVYSGRRLKQLYIFLSFIGFIFIVILLTDPIGFIGRLFAVVAPQQDGSAYIRLMELPNALLNIYHNPILGTALGTPWFQYYRMPTFANFSSIAVHNTYLYWPLRTGILGSVAFLWMLARMGKASLIMRRFVKTEEDHFYSVLAINILVIYMVGCFFGLLYGDGIIIIGIYQVALQLMMEEKLPGLDMRKILFWRTMFSREIVMKSSSLPAKTA